MIKSDDIIDYNSIHFRAAKIYQYTDLEKKKLCLDDEDFLNYIKNRYTSLKPKEKELIE